MDNCGGAATTPVAITVGSGSQSGNSQSSPEIGMDWLCTPAAAVQHLPSVRAERSSDYLGDDARRFFTDAERKFRPHGRGWQLVYSDVLWNNHLIGDFSSQGLPDTGHSIVPNVHNFTYDVYFYATDIGASQALEFDINQFVNGQSFIWGHECRIGGETNGTSGTIKAKVAPDRCSLQSVSNAWNHLVIQAQRTSDNHLLFKSISLNGQTSTLNYYESPTATSWYGITINYQQDGNYKQATVFDLAGQADLYILVECSTTTRTVHARSRAPRQRCSSR